MPPLRVVPEYDDRLRVKNAAALSILSVRSKYCFWRA